MVELVIFDLDGVLVNTKNIIYNAYRKIVSEVFKRPFSDDIDTFMRKTINRKFLLDSFGFTEEEKKIVNEKTADYYRNSIKDMKLFPGVRKTLKKLKEIGIKRAVATNTFHQIAVEVLENLGIIDLFDVVKGSENNERLKPDPYVLEFIMKSLSITPEKTIYVGDMIVDVQAGRNAKVKKVLAVSYGYHPVDMLKKERPDAIIDRIEDVLKYL